MRPIPVPAYVRGAPWVEGTAVFAAPDGDLTSDQIPPAEGIFYSSVMSGFGDRVFPMVGVVLQFEAEELEAIKAGASHVLLSWHGRVMPVFVAPQVIIEAVGS